MKQRHKLIKGGFYLTALLILITLLLNQLTLVNGYQLTNNYWHFFFIGILAATIANATGCGGGMVFLPAFLILGMDIQQTLATSFAIQAFGMSSGTLSWLMVVNQSQHSYHWRQLPHILLLSVPASSCGLYFAQQWINSPPINIQIIFCVFSISIGTLILYRLKHTPTEAVTQLTLNLPQQVAVISSCFIGGIITWWLSVGVGEILAIVLMMLGFNTRFAVALAVMVSAATVFSAIPVIVYSNPAIEYGVLLFAAPGALLGGYIARYLAMAISTTKLKAGFSLWIIFSSIGYIIAY